MSTVTKPMALDETFNTTESTPRNQADVLAGIQQAIREGFGQVAYAVEYDNTDSGLTATNVQDAIDEVDATLDVVEDDIESIEDDIESVKEVTGNPITLTDGSETYAQGLSVELEPVQDLHGYDFPWVGGAMKNKLGGFIYDDTTGSVSISGNTYVFNGGSGGTGFFVPIKANTQYTLHIDVTSGQIDNIRTYADTEGNELISVLSNVFDTENIITFTETVSCYLRIWVVSATVTAQLEEGSTATPWKPYSNICPISGYDGVEVEDVGVNQWDEEWEVGSIDNQGQNVVWSHEIRSKNYTECIPNTEYFNRKSQYPSAFYFYDSNKSFISYTLVGANTAFTTPSNAKFFRFRCLDDYGTTYNHDISINYPSTDTNYHPHQSRTASVTFGQTVYGGKSNFTDGGTDDELGIADLGSLSWVYSDGYFKSESLNSFIKRPSSNTETPKGLCEGFKVTYWNDSSDNAISITPTPIGTQAYYLWIKCSRYSDATTFKNAVSGVDFAYEKATHTTISTPPTDLKLLQGTNNITTNGTTITLDYIPNNSIGDAVKASEEYTDRAVERAIPKATFIDTWMISEESDTISVDLTSYDCNFFLFDYSFMSKRGTTLIPRPQGGSFSISVVTYYNGSAYYIELDYNPTTKVLSYTSNITSQFGVLSFYTI